MLFVCSICGSCTLLHPLKNADSLRALNRNLVSQMLHFSGLLVTFSVVAMVTLCVISCIFAVILTSVLSMQWSFLHCLGIHEGRNCLYKREGDKPEHSKMRHTMISVFILICNRNMFQDGSCCTGEISKKHCVLLFFEFSQSLSLGIRKKCK